MRGLRSRSINISQTYVSRLRAVSKQYIFSVHLQYQYHHGNCREQFIGRIEYVVRERVRCPCGSVIIASRSCNNQNPAVTMQSYVTTVNLLSASRKTKISTYTSPYCKSSVSYSSHSIKRNMKRCFFCI